MNTYVHPRVSADDYGRNRYPWFNDLLGDPTDKTVFDYGGCSGNLLYFSNGKIDENKYTSLDVGIGCIEQGKQDYPNSKFIHYNRFNWAYNHHGDIELAFPDVSKSQDLIWSYSVFSHTDLADFSEAVQWLLGFDYQKIAMSFLDIECKNIIEMFRDKRIKQYGTCVPIDTDADILYFVDNHQSIKNVSHCEPFDCRHFISFYSIDFLLEYFDRLNISCRVEKKYFAPDSYLPFLVIEQ